MENTKNHLNGGIKGNSGKDVDRFCLKKERKVGLYVPNLFGSTLKPSK